MMHSNNPVQRIEMLILGKTITSLSSLFHCTNRYKSDPAGSINKEKNTIGETLLVVRESRPRRTDVLRTLTAATFVS
jgi:hypothetical protein